MIKLHSPRRESLMDFESSIHYILCNVHSTSDITYMIYENLYYPVCDITADRVLLEIKREHFND